MSSTIQETFCAQTSRETLDALHQLAEAQNRPFEALVDEALRSYIQRQPKSRSSRRQNLNAFTASLAAIDSQLLDLTR